MLRALPAWLDREIAALNPGCFALVMATGIISNAMFFAGHPGLSAALFAANLVAYVWLVIATAWRIGRFARAAWTDLIDPRLTFPFFTAVAATDVLGIGLHLRGFAAAAFCLWLIALALWLVLSYVGFGVLILVNNAQGTNIIRGGWLIAIVGTQSLVLLGARIAVP